MRRLFEVMLKEEINKGMLVDETERKINTWIGKIKYEVEISNYIIISINVLLKTWSTLKIKIL